MKIINLKIYVLFSMFLFAACSSYDSGHECMKTEMGKLNIEKMDRVSAASALEEIVSECKQYP